jgi:mannose-6-phosphate isomerase-like protein (cupin superfamily)
MMTDADRVLNVIAEACSGYRFFGRGAERLVIQNIHVSIARARVEPGVTTRWHRLSGTGERYCIINGRGLVEMGNSPPQEVTACDVVIIPPLCRQRITNTGSDDLVFLAICTPRFSNDVYEDLEND